MLISGAGGGGFTQALLQGRQLGNQARALREQAHQRRQQLALGIGGLGLNAAELGAGLYGTIGSLSEAAARRQQSGEQFAQNLGQRKLEFGQGLGQQESEFARRLAEMTAGRQQSGQEFAQSLAQRGKEFETELPLRYPTVPGPNGPQQLSVAEALARMAEPEKQRTWASTEAEKGRTQTASEAERERAFRESLASMGHGFALDQLRTADELKRAAEAETYARELPLRERALDQPKELEGLRFGHELDLLKQKSGMQGLSDNPTYAQQQTARLNALDKWIAEGVFPQNRAEEVRAWILSPVPKGRHPLESVMDRIGTLETNAPGSLSPAALAGQTEPAFQSSLGTTLENVPPEQQSLLMQELQRRRAAILALRPQGPWLGSPLTPQQMPTAGWGTWRR